MCPFHIQCSVKIMNHKQIKSFLRYGVIFQSTCILSPLVQLPALLVFHTHIMGSNQVEECQVYEPFGEIELKGR